MFELFSELPIFLQRTIQILSVITAFWTYIYTIITIVGEWKKNQAAKRVEKTKGIKDGYWNKV
jgi:hypothetical protein